MQITDQQLNQDSKQSGSRMAHHHQFMQKRILKQSNEDKSLERQFANSRAIASQETNISSAFKNVSRIGPLS